MNDSLKFKCVISEHYTKNYTEKIISIIKENPSITRGELAVRFGVTRDGFVQISWHV